MDMDAPSAPQNELIDKPEINITVEQNIQDQNSFFKVAVPKPIETNKVVLKRGKFCCCLAISLCIFSAGLYGPLYRFLPFIGPSVTLIILLILLCILKKNYVIIKDKDNNNLHISETNYLCIGSGIANISLKDLKFSCFNSGRESGWCTTNGNLSTVKFYCTDKALYDLDTTDIQNIPFQTVYILKDCAGDEPELEEKLLGLSVEKFKNEVTDELKEAYKKGLKPPTRNMIIRISGDWYPIQPHCTKISKYFYFFIGFEILNGYGEDETKKKEKFKEIDWIYSKNYDRIFIGVVKSNNTYLNKRLYHVDAIQNFQFEKMGGKNNFQAVFKDGNSENICTFEHLPEEKLDTFIILINWQIHKIKGQVGQSNNFEENVITTDC